MKIFFDTEFIEDGSTIDLISIGMIREDEKTLYFENGDCDLAKANAWVRDNVIKNLKRGQAMTTKSNLAEEIKEFCSGFSPEFWGYYSSYDWVVLCQLFGSMIDLPSQWPMYCNDLKAYCEQKNISIYQDDSIHNALLDAIWIKEAAQSVGII